MILAHLKLESHKELNETLFKIMNSEKIIVSLIMILIVFISTFNVVASTVMLIVEKEKDIKALKILGCQNIILNVYFLNTIY